MGESFRQDSIAQRAQFRGKEQESVFLLPVEGCFMLARAPRQKGPRLLLFYCPPVILLLPCTFAEAGVHSQGRPVKKWKGWLFPVKVVLPPIRPSTLCYFLRGERKKKTDNAFPSVKVWDAWLSARFSSAIRIGSFYHRPTLSKFFQRLYSWRTVRNKSLIPCRDKILKNFLSVSGKPFTLRWTTTFRTF